jgi:hypothetical protein
MDSLPVGPVDAEMLDVVVALFEAQLREHAIKTSRDDLRWVIQQVTADQRYGFMLAATAPDGCPIGVAYASFAEISGDEFKDFVAAGATDEEVAKWIEQKAKPRPRVEIIKWNNEWRYKRLSEMPDGIQEFMEDYIPEFVPPHLRHHVDYFFDIYDAEEKRM